LFSMVPSRMLMLSATTLICLCSLKHQHTSV